jgi:hypothetical protein
VEVTTIRDLLFWTWVVGETLLALALIRQAAEWLRDAVRAGIIAPGVRRPRATGERALLWTHV